MGYFILSEETLYQLSQTERWRQIASLMTRSMSPVPSSAAAAAPAAPVSELLLLLLLLLLVLLLQFPLVPLAAKSNFSPVMIS